MRRDFYKYLTASPGAPPFDSHFTALLFLLFALLFLHYHAKREQKPILFCDAFDSYAISLFGVMSALLRLSARRSLSKKRAHHPPFFRNTVRISNRSSLYTRALYAGCFEQAGGGTTATAMHCRLPCLCFSWHWKRNIWQYWCGCFFMDLPASLLMDSLDFVCTSHNERQRVPAHATRLLCRCAILCIEWSRQCNALPLRLCRLFFGAVRIMAGICTLAGVSSRSRGRRCTSIRALQRCRISWLCQSLLLYTFGFMRQWMRFWWSLCCITGALLYQIKALFASLLSLQAFARCALWSDLLSFCANLFLNAKKGLLFLKRYGILIRENGCRGECNEKKRFTRMSPYMCIL